MEDEPANKRVKSERQLDQLSSFSIVVSDTGDVDAISIFHPQDATTNPSLIFKAAQLPQYQHLVTHAIEYGILKSNNIVTPETMEIIIDKLSVNFGAEITKIVPGYVSTEVDARLSFDTAGTITRARRIISMYAELGIDKSRILIKVILLILLSNYIILL